MPAPFPLDRLTGQCYIVLMLKNLLLKHITRLQAAIATRNPESSWDQELNKIDRQNIASLAEGRIPQYRDHMTATQFDIGDIEMFEFADCILQRNRDMAEAANTV